MKAIVTKSHPVTSTRGARVSATDNDGNKVWIACMGGGASDADHEAAVRKLCSVMDWHGDLVMGSLLGVGKVWVWRQEGSRAAEIVV